MSHFPVLVIGEDPVELLQPYHEFECTGTDDEYVQEIDETEEYRESYDAEEERPTFLEHVLDQIGYTDPDTKILRPGQERTEDHKYTFVEVDENDEVVRVVRRTNPNSHWDGWTLGGRWSRFFKLKPDAEFVIEHVGGGTLYTPEDGISQRPEHYEDAWTKKNRAQLVDKLTEAHSTDHARWKDIDIEATRDRAEKEARETFAKWREIYEKHGKPLPLSHFQTMRDEAVKRLKEQGIEKEEVDSLYESRKHKVTREYQEDERASMAYHDQPAIKAERKAYLCGLRHGPIDWFGYDEDAYAAKMRRKAAVPYAVIKDGKWYAKGKMHMFAYSDDEMTEDEWIEQIHKLYNELPEDALLTLVDCHV
jgi:hypothetical protein